MNLSLIDSLRIPSLKKSIRLIFIKIKKIIIVKTFSNVLLFNFQLKYAKYICLETTFNSDYLYSSKHSLQTS